MSWEGSDPKKFLKEFQDSKKQQPPPIFLTPSLLPDDDDLNKTQSALSEKSGGSTRAGDYGHFQIAQRSQLRPRHVPHDSLDLEGISGGPGLAVRLSAAMVTRPQKGSEDFLPLRSFWELCNPSNIRNALKERFQEPELSKYVEYVCGNMDNYPGSPYSARKIFAILVLMGRVKELEIFFRDGYSDNDLPFEKEGAMLRPRCHSSSADQQVDNATCFDESFARSFYREQWHVHIPFISKTKGGQVIEYDLHGETIMPWTSLERITQKSGYGDVYKVKIHDDHHPLGERSVFALKVLCPEKATNLPQEFEQELHALKKTKSGPHVIELFSTFKRGDELSFLFPWADGGNLLELMQKHPSKLLAREQRTSEALTKWLVKQCAGIADGLCGMHNTEPKFLDKNGFNNGELAKNYGIHGDIKPENILRFLSHEDPGKSQKDPGKLVLSDFGLTKFHSMISRSNQPGGGPVSATYASPEQTGDWLSISRRSDVWALGCVFSMLLTWAIRGPEGLEAFNDARHQEKEPGRGMNWALDTFYGLNKTLNEKPSLSDGFFLKNAVIDCIDKNKQAILGSDLEPNYLTEFLDFIRDKMLKIDKTDRATSEEVHEFLQKKMQKYQGTSSSIKLPSLGGL